LELGKLHFQVGETEENTIKIANKLAVANATTITVDLFLEDMEVKLDQAALAAMAAAHIPPDLM
jgi:hypothetical protein